LSNTILAPLAAFLVALSVCSAQARDELRRNAAPAGQAGQPVAIALPRPAPLPITSGVYDKNFYFFRVLESPGALAVLKAEPTLAALTLRYRERLVAALDSCGEKASCYINAARWPDAEISAVESALRALCRAPTADCQDMVVPLRESGTMIRFHGRADGDLLAEAWRLSGSGISHILSTYGDGAAPRYENIDSISHDPRSSAFGSLLRTALRVVLTTDVKKNGFFSDGLELAVARYRQHAAPFIVVSGGYVHPARTEFCEAIEMKRALIDDYKVPPSAILLEPHARHTTTNLRNTVRLMYRYGMPFSKPGIVVTDERQAAYIASDGFDGRNRLETGIVPYQGKKQVSPVEIEFVPGIEALQVGFEDPLDP